MREEHINPTVTKWESIKEQVIEDQIKILCQYIATHGASTEHNDIYDAIYEMIEEEVESAYDAGELPW